MNDLHCTYVTHSITQFTRPSNHEHADLNEL